MASNNFLSLLRLKDYRDKFQSYLKMLTRMTAALTETSEEETQNAGMLSLFSVSDLCSSPTVKELWYRTECQTTVWSTALLEKLLVTCMVKKFLVFYGTQRFRIVFTLNEQVEFIEE
jgi:hypothetical protein